MGGNVSSGQNNDELIDNLIESGLIKSNMVERVFRAVDRGIFYLPKFKHLAYRDLAWREGHIHISAPCIYTRVLESLELRANLSFLNIGSGTGYLSTMVGLILGPYGVNHNIELHADLIEYAREKVGEFVRTGVYFDDFEFCAPRFVHGNFLNLSVPASNTNPNDDSHPPHITCSEDGGLVAVESLPPLQYDRIYVGAGVSDEHEEFIKSLLKVDGILIMPLNDCLMKIRRINENLWEKNSIMTVSYASLITDSVSSSKKFSMPKLKPLTLQEICRFKIRQSIRQAIAEEHTDYYKVTREMSTFNKNRHVRSSTSERRVREYGRGEEDEDENQYDLYDSDEDDEFGGDEESGGEGRGGAASSTTTAASSSTSTSASTSAMNRFDRIFRPHLGLNISYARFDNQLRLLIGGSSRLSSSNSNRMSPQQENQPVTTTTTTTTTTSTESDPQNRNRNSNEEDDDDEPKRRSQQEQSTDNNNNQQRLMNASTSSRVHETTSGATTSQEDDRDGFVEELELRSNSHNHNSNSSRPSRTRLSWLPILSFRHEDTNELGVLMNVRQVFNINNNNEANSSSRRSEDCESVVSSTAATVASGRLSTTAQQPLSENPESEIDSEAAATTTTMSSSRQKSSEKRQQYGSASESGFSEESRVSDDKSSNANITKRKRNFSNGYNSETEDPSDGDRYGFGLSSSDEGMRRHNDSTSSPEVADDKLKEDVLSHEDTLESKHSPRSSSYSSSSSSSTDYHDNEECCHHDETFRNSDEHDEDEEKKVDDSNTTQRQQQQLDDALEEYADAIAGDNDMNLSAEAQAINRIDQAVSEILGESGAAVSAAAATAKNNEANPSSSGPIRENHLRARIMQLPLSPQVKSFLLYYREI